MRRLRVYIWDSEKRFCENAYFSSQMETGARLLANKYTVFLQQKEYYSCILNMDSAKETYLSVQNNSNLTLSQLLLLQISSQKHILKLHQYYLLIGSGSVR